MRRPGASLAAALALLGQGEARAAPMPLARPPGPTLEIATDPEHPGPQMRPSPYRSYGGGYDRSRRRRGGDDLTVGLGLALGRSRQTNSKDGTYGRVEVQGLGRLGRDGGPVVGAAFVLGGEYWKAPDGWGMGLFPFDLRLGYATPHILFRVNFGTTMFTVDKEQRRDPGVGLFIPMVGGNLGLDIDPVRVLLDARAIYRWHFTTPDTPQRQIGLLIELYTH